MEWADATVWRAVIDSSAASSDPIIKARLHHSHLVQHAFLNAWWKAPHSSNAGSDLKLTELTKWGREYHAHANEYLTSLTESSLDHELVVPWASSMASQLGRAPGTPTIGETILQVAAHSTYHRGQINTRLREVGAEPPLTDYIAWIWFGRPAPEWPMA